MNYSLVRNMLALLVLSMLCVACGPNNQIPLTYPPKDGSVLPAPGAPHVAVVLFSDKRPQAHLGTRSDGSTFTSTIAVSDWVARSFADALSRQGLQVSFAGNINQAKAANPNYIVTGVVNEASLSEISIAELRATMQIDMAVSGAQGVIMNEGLSASQNTSGIISTSTAENLLRQTVQELVRPASAKIAQKIMK